MSTVFGMLTAFILVLGAILLGGSPRAFAFDAAVSPSRRSDPLRIHCCNRALENSSNRRLAA